MAAGHHRGHAAGLDDGELARIPQPLEACGRGMQAEAGGRAAGEGERQRAIGCLLYTSRCV